MIVIPIRGTIAGILMYNGHNVVVPPIDFYKQINIHNYLSL